MKEDLKETEAKSEDLEEEVSDGLESNSLDSEPV
jgi:hypothetical protein